jgi:hypothetical protein
VDITDNTRIRVKIPNLDILVAFQQMFQDYCLRFCGLCEGEVNACADIFENLPTERNDEIFKEKFFENSMDKKM